VGAPFSRWVQGTPPPAGGDTIRRSPRCATIGGMEPISYLAAWREPRATSNRAAKKIVFEREKNPGSAEELAALERALAEISRAISFEVDMGMVMLGVPDSVLRANWRAILDAVESAGYVLFDIAASRLVVPMTEMVAPWPTVWSGPIAALRTALASQVAAAGGVDFEADAAEPTAEDFERTLRELASEQGWQVHRVGDPLPPELELRRHESPDLEALIPADLIDPSHPPTSVTASDFGSRFINRALKAAGVRPRDAMVAIGIAGRGHDVHGITLIRVPGVTATVLADAFAPCVPKPRGAAWTSREVAGRTIRTAPDITESVSAWWARDGLIVMISGPADWIDGAVAKLP
jgi:hypothetical protein